MQVNRSLEKSISVKFACKIQQLQVCAKKTAYSGPSTLTLAKCQVSISQMNIHDTFCKKGALSHSLYSGTSFRDAWFAHLPRTLWQAFQNHETSALEASSRMRASCCQDGLTLLEQKLEGRIFRRESETANDNACEIKSS